ncbi:MAG TPA: peptide-methionine (S)-S-oxide reductase MsrA [Candidatus Saccharimonadales bacterium]|nr:peptide-methionine (S)-S-oxide reductase MsrA [Candidatus Saccharimonadales bacterium]
METATLAGGCFWCTEALFKSLKGVMSIKPGYSGGDNVNPTYEEVSGGETGHAESIQIEFDPKIISFKDILYIFMKTHDPTTLNRQGADMGTQYRSAIFYHDEKQKKAAEELIEGLQKDYKDKIVTEITEFKNFYEAEDYHKNYYENHQNAPYCRLVIDPKLEKLKKNFSKFIK